MDPSPEKFVVTNVRIFKQIADEAYEKMVQSSNALRRPKDDGTEGWILVYDPSQSSFKQAMISIAFTGIWLEALLHLKIVHSLGEKIFQDYDNKMRKSFNCCNLMISKQWNASGNIERIGSAWFMKKPTLINHGKQRRTLLTTHIRLETLCTGISHSKENASSHSRANHSCASEDCESTKPACRPNASR